MAITYDSYEQTWSKLLSFNWEDTGRKVFIQLLSASYSHSRTDTTLAAIDGFEAGSPVELTGRSISTETSISCSDVSFGSQNLAPAYAVIYLAGGQATAVTDSLLFHLNLNNGDPVEINSRKKIVLGDILTCKTESLGLCVVASDISVQAYDTTFQNLLRNPFEDESSIYAAQLVGDGYTYSASHTTRVNLSYFAGNPKVLAAKTITGGDYALLACSDIDFKTEQGTLDAAYCIITNMNTGSPLPTDTLVACIKFNGGSTESVSDNIQLSSCGLFAVSEIG